MFDDFSHQVELTILILTAFFAFINQSFWREWAIAAGITLITMIVDILFFAKDSFIYDPDFVHWKDLNEPREFEFKNE
ncbi:MAG: hypothetical protein MJ252_11895 [archaeon]|nr:hypothetical protein [archaeon]